MNLVQQFDVPRSGAESAPLTGVIVAVLPHDQTRVGDDLYPQVVHDAVLRREGRGNSKQSVNDPVNVRRRDGTYLLADPRRGGCRELLGQGAQFFERVQQRRPQFVPQLFLRRRGQVHGSP